MSELVKQITVEKTKVVKETRFQCIQCGQQFEHHHHCLRHIDEVHFGPIPRHGDYFYFDDQMRARQWLNANGFIYDKLCWDGPAWYTTAPEEKDWDGDAYTPWVTVKNREKELLVDLKTTIAEIRALRTAPEKP